MEQVVYLAADEPALPESVDDILGHYRLGGTILSPGQLGLCCLDAGKPLE